MVFSSNLFLFLFLPAVLGLYFLAPRALKNALLLLASLVFYAWGEPLYVLLMIASIVMNYGFGLLLGKAWSDSRRKAVVALAVVVNLALLVTFKYGTFLLVNLNELLGLFGIAALPVTRLALPVGISFFTFHAITYVVDVYRRQVEVQRRLPDLALYIALFPQLVAGPIVRYRDVAEQLRERKTSLAETALGIRRFIVGLGKKVLIANVVAGPADHIFALPANELTGPIAWLGALCYTLQIYFDFSGYSDMALGLGHMLGFRFLENFRHPYVARSMREFWQRWHISLSTFFRDYLYIPLGGSRRPPPIVFRNLLIVFFLCGLWHGASWSFVVWGLYHGTFLVLERLPILAPLGRAPRLLQHAYAVFVALVGWVFFRADSLRGALHFLAAMFGLGPGSWRRVQDYLTPDIALVLLLGAVGSAPLLDALAAWRARPRAPLLEGVGAAFELVALAAVFVLCALYLAAGTHNPFIYYRF